MTLIVSESGIRGIIGGKGDYGFNPSVIIKYVCAFFQFLKNDKPNQPLTILIGRDSRHSGDIYQSFIISTLRLLGANVINLDLTTTPSIEMAVINTKSNGAIMITASHNPIQWNALKLLNSKGEFLNKSQISILKNISKDIDFNFANYDQLGKYKLCNLSIDEHIDSILNLKLIDIELIKSKNFKVVVDGINSTGSIAIPKLLYKIGVSNIVKVNCENDGNFAHNPEPLEQNLLDTKKVLLQEKADLAICVDPDVDRLVVINEDGSMFGEEYTLVACADYILSMKKGTVVSNLSSSKALYDLAKSYGCQHHYSAVGEINVVEKMKEVDAIIGGEGNGGLIYPKLHYGRDAVLATAFFLAQLSKLSLSPSRLKSRYSSYFMSKIKVPIKSDFDIVETSEQLKHKYKGEYVKTYSIDGFRMDFDNEWFHIRKSNTEPILRIYSEAKTKKKADELSNNIAKFLKK